MANVIIAGVELSKNTVVTNEKVTLKVYIENPTPEPLAYRLAFQLGNKEHKIKS